MPPDAEWEQTPVKMNQPKERSEVRHFTISFSLLLPTDILNYLRPQKAQFYR